MSLDGTPRPCRLCQTESALIIEQLGVCGQCLHTDFDRAKPLIEAAHAETRHLFDLPAAPPRSLDGVACPLCARNCQIGPGEQGYCGLRVNESGRLRHLAGTPSRGVLHWYRDPLPTNCVADFVCPGGTGCGYPKYAVRNGPEHGYRNLAVFYHSCSFNCLYCQNAQFKENTLHGPAVHARDAPAVSGEALVTLRPYIELSQRLGLLIGQLVQTGIKSIEAQYCGAAGELDLGPLTTAFITGLLTPIIKEDVNMVNAPLVAKERGIDISETKVSRSDNFTSLLRYKVTTERKEHSVEGTLFGLSEPRMVGYGPYRGEFDLAGDVMLINATDKPGVIGSIGTELGKRGVNISHFQFAREKEGGEALLFFNTDSKVDNDTSKGLEALDNIMAVKRLSF